MISHDGFNDATSWRSIIVVPISTSKAQRKRGPTAISLSKSAGGLKQDSVALCHQVTTLDRAKLTDKIGRLSVDYLQGVEMGLKIAMDLP